MSRTVKTMVLAAEDLFPAQPGGTRQCRGQAGDQLMKSSVFLKLLIVSYFFSTKSLLLFKISIFIPRSLFYSADEFRLRGHLRTGGARGLTAPQLRHLSVRPVHSWLQLKREPTRPLRPESKTRRFQSGGQGGGERRRGLATQDKSSQKIKGGLFQECFQPVNIKKLIFWWNKRRHD